MTADELRAWRGRLGWTQRQAAAQIGVSKSMYRNYEYGHEIPRPVAVAAVALERLPDLRLPACNGLYLEAGRED